jgi:hypothetical protein
VRRLQLGGMLVGVMLHGFFGVPDGMHGVAMSHVRVMPGLDVIAVVVVAGGFAMMLGSLQMVFNAFVFRHVVLSSLAILRAAKYGAMKG